MARAAGGATPNTILDHAWPPDLDPARVPFRQRTITTLQRMRLLNPVDRRVLKASGGAPAGTRTHSAWAAVGAHIACGLRGSLQRFGEFL